MSKKTHDQEVAELAAQLHPKLFRRPTDLNPNGLSIDQRMPDISQRLLIVEKLLEAAQDKRSGALPGPNADDEEWNDWFAGLQRIVRDARRIAEDCFELASFSEQR